ncbi:MAG TPA: DUF1993 domain-containing protein [Kofleriaceae bacterium]|jgi:hypothetical protein
MSIHLLVREIQKMLRNLDGCLEKAALQLPARNLDERALLDSRLAPDMFPLLRQVQIACDTAKFAAARTSGQEAPSHADDEKSVAELRKRIATVVEYLDGYKAADFEGAEERRLSLPRWEGKTMSAREYFLEHAVPNFFFHTTTAYALLRHSGVEIGKRDFLGPLPLR